MFDHGGLPIHNFDIIAAGILQSLQRSDFISTVNGTASAGTSVLSFCIGAADENLFLFRERQQASFVFQEDNRFTGHGQRSIFIGLFVKGGRRFFPTAKARAGACGAPCR